MVIATIIIMLLDIKWGEIIALISYYSFQSLVSYFLMLQQDCHLSKKVALICFNENSLVIKQMFIICI